MTDAAGRRLVRWPTRLAPGTDTVRAVQTDMGHTSPSPGHSIGPRAEAIGSTAALAAGRLTIASAAGAPAGVPR